MAIGMFISPIDERTGADTLEMYATYADEEVLYDDSGRWKDYCDGQTSPTAPRYADDRSGMLWMHDPTNAREIQQILRQDVANRIMSGDLPVTRLPSWINALSIDLFNPAVVGAVSADVTALVVDTITQGQAETATRAMLTDFGNIPNTADILEWLDINRQWELFAE